MKREDMLTLIDAQSFEDDFGFVVRIENAQQVINLVLDEIRRRLDSEIDVIEDIFDDNCKDINIEGLRKLSDDLC